MQTCVCICTTGAVQLSRKRHEMTSCMRMSTLDVELLSFWGLTDCSTALVPSFQGPFPHRFLQELLLFHLPWRSWAALDSCTVLGKSSLTYETMGTRWTMARYKKSAGKWSPPEAGPSSWYLAHQNWVWCLLTCTCGSEWANRLGSAPVPKAAIY